MNILDVRNILNVTGSTEGKKSATPEMTSYSNDIVVDSDLSLTSTNPVQNKVITSALNGKQETLVSGSNIKTLNNTSLLGVGNISIDGLPTQTGNNGKFLTTDGTDASWADTGVSTKVSKSGDTMTGNLVINSGSTSVLQTKSTTETYNTAPASTTDVGCIQLLDKNGQYVGQFVATRYTDNHTSVRMQGYSSAGVGASVELVSWNSGNSWYVIGPTPSYSSTGATLVTAEWSRYNFPVKDLSTLSTEGQITASIFSMPSNLYDDLTLGASGTSYSAPSNGWFVLQKRTDGNTNQYIALSNTAGGLSQERNSNVSNSNLSICCPARKGDSIYISYNAAGNTERFRFIYSEGSKSEKA